MDVKGSSPDVSGDTVSTDTGPSVPPARTQAQRRERTRGALIDAARVLFAEQGYAGAGREEIVERAGVTRGAMYHHFNSKEALFQAVFEVVEQELCEAIALSAMAGSDPIDQLRLGARAFLEAAATGEVRRIVLLDAPAVLPIEVRRQLSERYGLGMVRGALRHADAAGRLKIGPVDALALIVMAVLHEAATAIADGDDPAAMLSVIDGLIDAISRP
jgi:AcrR family transcriptional regulator